MLKPENVEIEFRPHVVGYRAVEGRPDEPVELDHWYLFINDGPDGRMRQAGYVKKAEGGAISLIRRFDVEIVAKIYQLVEAQKGTRKAPQMPPDMSDDDDDDDDEEPDDDYGTEDFDDDE